MLLDQAPVYSSEKPCRRHHFVSSEEPRGSVRNAEPDARSTDLLMVLRMRGASFRNAPGSWSTGVARIVVHAQEDPRKSCPVQAFLWRPDGHRFQHRKVGKTRHGSLQASHLVVGGASGQPLEGNLSLSRRPGSRNRIVESHLWQVEILNSVPAGRSWRSSPSRGFVHSHLRRQGDWL